MECSQVRHITRLETVSLSGAQPSSNNTTVIPSLSLCRNPMLREHRKTNGNRTCFWDQRNVIFVTAGLRRSRRARVCASLSMNVVLLLFFSQSLIFGELVRRPSRSFDVCPFVFLKKEKREGTHKKSNQMRMTHNKHRETC